MSKRKEKNNVIKYSQTKSNNELFQEQVNQNRINQDDLLGKTRAITFLEKTQLLQPVITDHNQSVPELKKDVKEYKRIVLAMLILLLVGLFGLYSFILFRSKFKDITVEVGTKDLSANSFLVSKIYRKKASLVTDLSKVDYSKVGDYKVVLKYGNKEEEVSLKVEDTTPPVVEFQDVFQYTGYKIEANDFIKNVEDYSDYTVEYKTDGWIDTTKYMDYVITVIVKDSYGNETSKDCILSLGWLKKNVTLEAGTRNIKSNLVAISSDASKIPDSAIKEIDVTQAGEYQVNVFYDGEAYTSLVKIVDTTPPTLNLNSVSIYENERVSKDSFIRKASDNSGKVTTKLKTEIKYGKFGKQTIVIEATDPSGNVTIKETTLTIKEDKKPPVFSGLTTLSIKKNAVVDYRKGVKAVDNIDGSVAFTYDDSKVSYSEAGTFYVTYTAKDKKGNKVVSKRTVKIKHDASDTKALVNKYASTLGNDIPSMVNGVRKYIRYSSSWGDDDPVWYGLKERRGNCYVHAKVLQEVFNRKGITSKLIWTKDKSHYWNLVYTGGHWRHVDSTPGNLYVLLTDDEMAAKRPVSGGGGWNRENWPAAN